MRPTLREIAVMAIIMFVSFGFTLGCGGGSSDSGGGGDGGGGGGGTGGTGPSGLTCTGGGDCFGPTGTQAMSCPASVGLSPAVIPSDLDYVLTSLNNIRTNLGLAPFVRTAALDAFALAAATDLMNGGGSHAYFAANAGGSPAFTGFRAENQTSPSGWSPNATTTEIDEIIACFMSEEDDPAGFQKGHWEAIVCPCFTRIGVGLTKNGGGNLFMSLEFSE